MMTEDISKRLRASVAMNAVNGDSFERGVCAKQMIEAAATIEVQAAEISALRERAKELEEAIRKEFPEPDMNAHDGPCCSGFEGGRWVSTGCDCGNSDDTAAASEWRRDANLHLKFKALLSTRREEA